MLIDGLRVMLVGVGAVFVFLGLLVTALWLLSRCVARWERGRPQDEGPSLNASWDDGVVAAAVAAVIAKRGRQA